MASAFAHALVAYTSKKIYKTDYSSSRLLIFAIIWSIVPDLDSIGFFLGIPYGDVFGHRGISHSIFFAIISSIILVKLVFQKTNSQRIQNHNRVDSEIYLVIFFSLVMTSHGILDGLTTGGLGIAYFAPFDNSRYFLPWRPIVVSPIGIKSFFSDWGIRVILSEAIWVGIPCLSIIIMSTLYRAIRPKK